MDLAVDDGPTFDAAHTDGASDATATDAPFVDGHTGDAPVSDGGTTDAARPDAGAPDDCHIVESRPSPFCAGVTACAVREDATLTCDEGAFGLSIAGASGDSGYVYLTTNFGDFHQRLFTIEPRGTVGVETDPFVGGSGRVATDADGNAVLFGAEVSGSGIAYFHQDAGAWIGERVSPDETEFYQVRGGGVGPDGTTHVLWGQSHLTLSTLAPGGSWSSHDLGSNPFGNGSLGVDQGNRAYAVRWTIPTVGMRALTYNVNGTGEPTSIFTESTSVDEGTLLRIAIPGDGAVEGRPVVSVNLPDGIHAFLNRSDSWMNVLVPNSQDPLLTGCPALGPGGPGGGEGCLDGTTCTETGDGAYARAHGVAAVSDGNAFIAYTERHVERDYTIRNRCSEAGCICIRELNDDRSTAELVIAQLPLFGGATVTPVIRFDLGVLTGDSAEIELAGYGHNLYVAIFTTDGSTSLVRYLVVDESTFF